VVVKGVRIFVSTAPPDAAPGIARALVEAGLAACVNVVPGVRSVYSWKGELCDDAESILLVKSTAERGAELAARLAELHPYELPELVALDVVDGESSPEYLRWVVEAVRPRVG
jgi:periplasmic divalent cation tolerance protein